MVFMILTRNGWDTIFPKISHGDCVWVNYDVLTKKEISHLRKSGLELSVWNRYLNMHDFTCEIATVAEHHPDEIVFAEAIVR